MRFIVSILLTALLAFALGFYFPWWTVAVAAFAVQLLIVASPGESFLSGFAGVFLLWAILAWTIDASNNHVLAPRIASILPLGGSVAGLILLTAFIGGLIGGFGALSGSLLRRILHKP